MHWTTYLASEQERDDQWVIHRNCFPFWIEKQRDYVHKHPDNHVAGLAVSGGSLDVEVHGEWTHVEVVHIFQRTRGNDTVLGCKRHDLSARVVM